MKKQYKPKFKYYWLMNDVRLVAFYSMPVKSGEHILFSDVSAETLVSKGHTLPRTPDYDRWKRLVQLKQRCGRCFYALRGLTDLNRHMKIAHNEEKE